MRLLSGMSQQKILPLLSSNLVAMTTFAILTIAMVKLLQEKYASCKKQEDAGRRLRGMCWFK